MPLWTRESIRLGTELPQRSRQWSRAIIAQRHSLVYGEDGIVDAPAPDQNLHTDDAAARRQGLESAVGAAPQAIAQVHSVMMSAFGEGWIAGGKISVKMIKPLRPEDFTTAKGRIVGLSLEQTADSDEEVLRAECVVWVERRDHIKILVGTASAIVRG